MSQATTGPSRIDVLKPEYRANRYPVYEALRALGPGCSLRCSATHSNSGRLARILNWHPARSTNCGTIRPCS